MTYTFTLFIPVEKVHSWLKFKEKHPSPYTSRVILALVEDYMEHQNG